MRKIIGIFLLLFVCNFGFSQLVNPKQIKPDTLNRIIIMTDTITEVDTVFREFKYYSIDSLVRQIVNDSLGIDSLWKKDGTYSLRQSYSPNNNFLFGINAGNGLTTGNYNVFFGNNFPALSTQSYNFISGNNIATNATNINTSVIFGNDLNNTAISTITGSLIFGETNLTNQTETLYSYIGGNNNVTSAAGYTRYSFINGAGNNTNGGNNAYNFINGFGNGPNLSLTSFAFINGQNNVLNATRANYSFVNGRDNLRLAGIASSCFVSGYRNIYQSTSNLSNIIAIGTENGYNTGSHANSIYLGYRQGYTTGAANKLMIGMVQDDYLLGGDFSADWIRVNGYFEVRDKTGTAGNIAAWDGDKLVDSGTSLASIGGDPDQTLSYNGATSDLTISGTGGNTIALPEMVAYPIGSTGYGYRPEISGALAGGEPLLITEGSGINIVDNGVGTGFSISATDASTTNELQTISKSGELVTLSDSGGSFSTHTVDTGTDIVIVQPGNTTSDVVVNEIQFSYDAADAPTTIAGRNAFNRLAQVTVGSGLSFNTGTGTLTATDASTTNEIQTLSYTSTTGAISLSTGGGTITLNPPIGGLLSGSGTFTSSTPTKINFTSSLSDGITASTVNEDLTIPSTGYYRITANGIIAVEDDAVFNVYVYVNGSVARSYSLTQTAGNDARVISFNFIQSLTSGWAVDVRVAKTSGSSNVQASSWDLMAEFIKT